MSTIFISYLMKIAMNYLPKFSGLVPLLVMALLWVGPQVSLAQTSCGVFNFDSNEKIDNSDTDPELLLTAGVNGNTPTPPVEIRFDYYVYRNGVFYGLASATVNWTQITGTTFGYASTSNIPLSLDNCGDYYAEIVATGLDASGNACYVAFITTDEICVSQVNDGIFTFACEPGCGGGIRTDRLAQSTGLALEATPQASGSALLLRAHSPEATQATFQLLDLRGQVLMERRLDLAQGWTPHKLSTASLSAGIYLLRLHTSREQVSQKVILR
jgi:hypothetical protein